MLQLKSKSYNFSKLQNLALRQAQAAASIETTNTQPSSHEEQPEPTLVYSPHSWETADEFLPLLLTTNAVTEKDKFPKVKEMKLPLLLLVTKAIRGKNKTLKFMTIQIPSDY